MSGSVHGHRSPASVLGRASSPRTSRRQGRRTGTSPRVSLVASAATQKRDRQRRPPRRRPPTQPPAPAHQREHEKRRAQDFRPSADVADRFRHHRMDGEAAPPRQTPRRRSVREPPGQMEQQDDVQHVQEHVGHMEAERRRHPRRARSSAYEKLTIGRVTAPSTIGAKIRDAREWRGLRRPYGGRRTRTGCAARSGTRRPAKKGATPART